MIQKTLMGAVALVCLLGRAETVPACTAFCLDTPDGPVYAANLDLGRGEGHLFANPRGLLKESYRENVRGETLTWVSTYGSISFNVVGRELPWSGMNEAGLCGTALQLSISECPEVGEPVPLGEANLLQYLLDTCATVEQALAAVDGVTLAPWECSVHYMVVDATGASAVLEFLGGRLVTYSAEDLPLKALANAPYGSGIDYAEYGDLPAFNPGASVERMVAAAARCAAFADTPGADAVLHAMDTLTETVVAPKRWWMLFFDEPYTRLSAVFDIPAREIHFQTVTHEEIRSIHLDAFDFSCHAPPPMFDMNAKTSGWIDDEFGPYDHDENLKVFREFCADWGIEVSAEDSAALVSFFDAYSCADGSPQR